MSFNYAVHNAECIMNQACSSTERELASGQGCHLRILVVDFMHIKRISLTPDIHS